MGINSYKDLRVWQRAMDLAVRCYGITGSFPKDETYGLTSQIRRSSTSIPANIAEGHGREHTGSFIQYSRIAQGSLKELETHLILAVRLGYLDEDGTRDVMSEIDELGKMIRSMIRRLQEKAQ